MLCIAIWKTLVCTCSFDLCLSLCVLLCAVLLQTPPGWVNGRVAYENVDWQKVSVAELRLELQRKNLPVSGKKAALIERLKQHAESVKQQQQQQRQQQQQAKLVPECAPSPSDSLSRSSMSAMSPTASEMSTSTSMSTSNCPTPQLDRPPSAPPHLDGVMELDSSSEMSMQEANSPGLVRLWPDDSDDGSTAGDQLRNAAAAGLAGVARPVAMRTPHPGNRQHIDALNLLMPAQQQDLMMQLVETKLAETNKRIEQHQQREFEEQRQREEQEESLLHSHSQPQQQQQQQEDTHGKGEKRASSALGLAPIHSSHALSDVPMATQPQQEPHSCDEQAPRQREELDRRGRLRDLDFLASQNQQITELQHEPRLRERTHRRRSHSANQNQKRHSWVSSMPSKSGHTSHPQRQLSLPGHTAASASVPGQSPHTAFSMATPITTTATTAAPPVTTAPVVVATAAPATTAPAAAAAPLKSPSTRAHPPLGASKSYAAGTTSMADHPMLPLSPRSATTDTSLVSPLAHGATMNMKQRTNSFNSPKSPPVRSRARPASSSGPGGRSSRSLSVPTSPVQSPQHSPHSSQHNLNMVEERLFNHSTSHPSAIPSSPQQVPGVHGGSSRQCSPRSSSPATSHRSQSSPSGSYRSRSKTDSYLLGAVAASPLSFQEYANTQYYPFGSPSSHSFGSPRSNVLGTSPGLSFSSQDLGAANDLASSPGVSSAASLPSLIPWLGNRSSSQPCSPQARRRGIDGSFDSLSSPLGRSPCSTVRSVSPLTLSGHGCGMEGPGGLVNPNLLDHNGLDRSPLPFMHHPRSSSFSGCFGAADGVPMHIDPVS